MKYIYGHDTQEPNDFGVRVSDKVYEAMKQYLVQHHLKHPQEVEFLKEWGNHRMVGLQKNEEEE